MRRVDYKISKTNFGEKPHYELPKPLFYKELGEDGLIKLFNNFYDLLVESDISNFFPQDEKELEISDIKKELKSLQRSIEYYPPKYSAKKIDGKRAYDLAREGKDVTLKKSVMEVSNTKFISYSHPFITFEASVSEGSYIRSLAQILLEKLNRVV